MTIEDKRACAREFLLLYANKVEGVFPSHEWQEQNRGKQKQFRPVEEKSFEEIFQEALDKLE